MVRSWCRCVEVANVVGDGCVRASECCDSRISADGNRFFLYSSGHDCYALRQEDGGCSLLGGANQCSHTGRSDGELAEPCTRVKLPAHSAGLSADRRAQGLSLLACRDTLGSKRCGCLAHAFCGVRCSSLLNCQCTHHHKAGLRAAATHSIAGCHPKRIAALHSLHCCTRCAKSLRERVEDATAARRRSAATPSLAHRCRTAKGKILHR